MLFKIREWNNLPTRIKTFFSNKRIKDLFPHINDWSWLPIVGLIHDLGKVFALEEWGAYLNGLLLGIRFQLVVK